MLREERAHYRCENCGVVEACCEGATLTEVRPALETLNDTPNP